MESSYHINAPECSTRHSPCLDHRTNRMSCVSLPSIAHLSWAVDECMRNDALASPRVMQTETEDDVTLPPISSLFHPALFLLSTMPRSLHNSTSCEPPSNMHNLLRTRDICAALPPLRRSTSLKTSYKSKSSSATASCTSYDHYSCPQCFKTFSRPSNLKIHSYSHTGERPFVCSARGCGRSFSVRSNMRRHMRVHGL